ncbi:Arm DNA-binding domain-containing protein [Chromobacterium haemolyticum]|nr:Arm DNA-binding domain-containing protein [Chromobacterium haemolyticum]
MALTDISIRQAKPQEKTYHLSDGSSLFLEVTPSGGKLWRYRFRFNGKAAVLALGKYPDVGLAEARNKAGEARNASNCPRASTRQHNANPISLPPNCPQPTPSGQLPRSGMPKSAMNGVNSTPNES